MVAEYDLTSGIAHEVTVLILRASGGPTKVLGARTVTSYTFAHFRWWQQQHVGDLLRLNSHKHHRGLNTLLTTRAHCIHIFLGRRGPPCAHVVSCSVAAIFRNQSNVLLLDSRASTYLAVYLSIHISLMQHIAVHCTAEYSPRLRRCLPSRPSRQHGHHSPLNCAAQKQARQTSLDSRE